MDIVLIESAINKGAKKIIVSCANVDNSWRAFASQFEFVQAAGGFVLDKEGRALFIYRLEKWDLPKGKVEEGEKIDDAALREVEEECSISNLVLGNLLCRTWHTYKQKDDYILKATDWYLMEYTGNEVPIPQAIEGITDVRWLSLNQLEMVNQNTYPSVLDVIAEYRQMNEG